MDELFIRFIYELTNRYEYSDIGKIVNPSSFLNLQKFVRS
jgi:hypothetical protein